MIELLEQYSITEIIIFIVLLSSSFKGMVTFWDWFVKWLKGVFQKDHDELARRAAVNTEIKQNLEQIKEIAKKQDELITQINTIQKTVDLLIHSDKDDIKSWITKEHHYFCYEQKFIDDYSLDCIEKRFAHYREEGGNSFIEELMKELRALPKVSMLDGKHQHNNHNNNN